MYRFQTAARSEDAQVFSEQVLRYADHLGSPANSALTSCQHNTIASAARREGSPPAQVQLPSVPVGERPSVRQWQYGQHARPAAADLYHDWQWQRDSGTSPAVLDFQQQAAPVYGPARGSLPCNVAPEWHSPTGDRTIIHQQQPDRQQSIQQQLSFPNYSAPTSVSGWQHSSSCHGGNAAAETELALLRSQFEATGLESSTASADVHATCFFKPNPEQNMDAAAVAAAAWPGPCSLPASPSSGDLFGGSSGSQASGCSDIFPADAQDAARVSCTARTRSSSPEKANKCIKNEAQSESRQTKFAGRKRTKIDHITVEFLRKHNCFDMPLAEAAKSLDIGLSVMKRVCRTLGLTRWPYRTRASLRSVIEKTDKYLAERGASRDEGEACSGQKAHVLEALQSHMDAVTGQGGSDLNAAIKKYRQSIFKLNYKLKKSKMNCKARHRIAVPHNAAERILADHS